MRLHSLHLAQKDEWSKQEKTVNSSSQETSQWIVIGPDLGLNSTSSETTIVRMVEAITMVTTYTTQI